VISPSGIASTNQISIVSTQGIITNNSTFDTGSGNIKTIGRIELGSNNGGITSTGNLKLSSNLNIIETTCTIQAAGISIGSGGVTATGVLNLISSTLSISTNGATLNAGAGGVITTGYVKVSESSSGISSTGVLNLYSTTSSISTNNSSINTGTGGITVGSGGISSSSGNLAIRAFSTNNIVMSSPLIMGSNNINIGANGTASTNTLNISNGSVTTTISGDGLRTTSNGLQVVIDGSGDGMLWTNNKLIIAPRGKSGGVGGGGQIDYNMGNDGLIFIPESTQSMQVGFSYLSTNLRRIDARMQSTGTNGIFLVNGTSNAELSSSSTLNSDISFKIASSGGTLTATSTGITSTSVLNLGSVGGITTNNSSINTGTGGLTVGATIVGSTFGITSAGNITSGIVTTGTIKAINVFTTYNTNYPSELTTVSVGEISTNTTGNNTTATGTFLSMFITPALGITSLPAGVFTANLKCGVRTGSTGGALLYVELYQVDINNATQLIGQSGSTPITSTTIYPVTYTLSTARPFAVTDKVGMLVKYSCTSFTGIFDIFFGTATTLSFNLSFYNSYGITSSGVLEIGSGSGITTNNSSINTGTGGITVGAGGISSSSGNLIVTASTGNTINLNSDILVATGKKITSDYTPVVNTDVANKAYVDTRVPLVLLYYLNGQSTTAVLDKNPPTTTVGTGLILSSTGSKPLTTVTTIVGDPKLTLLPKGSYTLNMSAKVSVATPTATFSFTMYRLNSAGSVIATIGTSTTSAAISAITSTLVSCTLTLSSDITIADPTNRIQLVITYTPVVTHATYTLLVDYGSGGSTFVTPPINGSILTGVNSWSGENTFSSALTASGGVLTSTIDTPSAGTLTIGGTNCTGISFNDSILALTLASGQYITCGGATTMPTVSSQIGYRTELASATSQAVALNTAATNIGSTFTITTGVWLAELSFGVGASGGFAQAGLSSSSATFDIIRTSSTHSGSSGIVAYIKVTTIIQVTVASQTWYIVAARGGTAMNYISYSVVVTRLA